MREVVLTGGHVTLISDEDCDLVTAFRWTPAPIPGQPHLYFRTTRKGVPPIKLHRLIAGAIPGEEVDHANGNTLDNRRENLRICTRTQNRRNSRKSKRNTSGYKGVHWHKLTRKWRARVRIGARVWELGLYANKQDAAQAYWNAAYICHGEFACLQPSS